MTKPPHYLAPSRVISEIQSGNAKVLEEIYVRYREDFFRWARRRFNAGRQDFEDAWQDAIIAFYQQVQCGKIVALRHEIHVWLFAVGYKRLLNNNRKLKRILWKDQIDDALLEGINTFQEQPVEPEKRHQLQSAMKTMSPQCREMLVQRYYLEHTIEEMQRAWDFNNSNTTSATLSRCLKRLKELIQKTSLVRP